MLIGGKGAGRMTSRRPDCGRGQRAHLGAADRDLRTNDANKEMENACCRRVSKINILGISPRKL